MRDTEYEKPDKLPVELKPEQISHAVEIMPARRDGHNWRQHGLSVDCTSCEFTHGFSIKVDQQLTGIDANGYPIVKSITV